MDTKRKKKTHLSLSTILFQSKHLKGLITFFSSIYNLFLPIAPQIRRFNMVNGKTWVLYFLAYPTHGLSHLP